MRIHGLVRSFAVVSFALASAFASGEPISTISKGAASGCPAFLSKIPQGEFDLCGLATRYADARAKLVGMGYTDPDRIAEVIAPRFIAYPDWNKKKEKDKVKYNPWVVYCPAPQTWASWERANQSITKEAKWDLAQGRLSSINVDWIVNLWRLGMSELQVEAGIFRNEPGMEASAKQTSKDAALTDAQVAYITNLPFRKFVQAPVGASIISWESKSCGLFGSGGKNCGIIRYPDGVEVVPQLTALANEYNAWAANGAANFDTTKLVQSIARLQQWIISIHPFDNGNGRTSRLLMDRIFFGLGLPAPLLEDQNIDLYLTGAEWARHVYAGLERSVRQYEACVANPSAPGCRETSLTPPNPLPKGVCLDEE